ncbi:MAG: hypothetical protein NTY77_10315 [Elusimicrobia bacterium]|nr:hypothetical protein [Elusimicrobiota bacterium]
MQGLGWCAVFLASALLAASARAQDSAKSDDEKGRPHLTPYQWQKPAPTASDDGKAQAGRPALRGLTQPQSGSEDELICEKGVVHPTQGPSQEAAKQNPALLLMKMGVQHCWKKSDPNTIIERPVGMQDMVTGAVTESMQGGGNAIGRRLPPLKGPRPFTKPKDKAKKKLKAKAPAAPAAAPAAPPAAKPEGDGTSSGTPQLLR